MAFSKEKFPAVFTGGNSPHLISVYAATGTYTEMPRAMHRHEDVLELILIRKGQGVHIIQGKSYNTSPGDLLIINSGAVHDESSRENEDLAIYSCAITGLCLPGLAANHLTTSDRCPLLKTGSHFPRFVSLFQLMYEVTSENGPHGPEIANNLLHAILLLILERLAQEEKGLGSQENDLLREVRTYLDSHYMEPLTLEELAESFHVNSYHLAHIFKKFYGYPLIQYMTRRRIGEAQTLLIDSAMSITDIALSVGYGSSSHFNRAFQKLTGMSPRNYRNLYRQI